MVTLTDLIAQKEAIERQILQAQSSAKADAIAMVRELMSMHGLTPADLKPAAKRIQGVKSGSKVAPKYRNPVSGSTWTGRGLTPRWLTAAIEDGKTLQDFAI